LKQNYSCDSTNRSQIVQKLAQSKPANNFADNKRNKARPQSGDQTCVFCNKGNHGSIICRTVIDQTKTKPNLGISKFRVNGRNNQRSDFPQRDRRFPFNQGDHGRMTENNTQMCSKRNPEQQKWYCNILQKHIHEGTTEVFSSTEGQTVGTYYMPHSGVWKPTKKTPLRIGFDASSKWKNKPSLNDAIHKGESFTNKIHDILPAS
uniref:Reverse transcriptase domain-containing protein n=1 Tax=Heligmosomoides polygyrus TaxID=6339 RepID=A0A183FMB6_HELPZ